MSTTHTTTDRSWQKAFTDENGIRHRRRKDGTVGYTVEWRDKELGKSSETFSDYQRALSLRRFLTANGNTLRLALEAKRRATENVPTVTDLVNTHIGSNRNVTEGGRADQYRMIKNHLQGTERLKEYLVQGVVINNRRLEQLGSMVEILQRSSDEVLGGVAEVLSQYLPSLQLLQR